MEASHKKYLHNLKASVDFLNTQPVEETRQESERKRNCIQVKTKDSDNMERPKAQDHEGLT